MWHVKEQFSEGGRAGKPFILWFVCKYYGSMASVVKHQ